MIAVVKRFERLINVIFDLDVVAWLTVCFVVLVNIVGNVEPIKLIKFCATLGFMYAAFSYMEIKRLRRLIEKQKQDG